MKNNQEQLEQRIENLEKRIKDIEKRNKRVEGDKAWETCMLRKVLIVVLTYIFAVIWTSLADTTNPFLGAIVPCAGFLLSGLTIIVIKKWWINKRK